MSEPRRGLLVDYGGVLTSDVFASFRAFCRAEGLEPDAIRLRFREDRGARALLDALETGRLSEAEFEPRFAALLGVREHEGLIDRLFEEMRADEEMLEALRAARAAGVRTGLLSNSWGAGRYDREQFPALFDGVVISGEVGLRKPTARIYELAAQAIELEPRECVFVDDLAFNLEPARELGMATVHHTDTAATLERLEELLEVDLRPARR